MTEKLYDKDSFIQQFFATVISCEQTDDGFDVVLDRTAFFPEGGGQPSDIGTINDYQVFDVQIKDEIIVHKVKNAVNVGETVNCVLDFERRFDFMQQHSGEHIVSGIVHSMLGYENVGFHLSEETVTLDFNGTFTEEQIIEIERRANRCVWENVAFKTYYPSKLQLKTLEYRSKKELEGAVRIVEAENIDRCACCAPHVKSASQIGFIKLLDHEKVRTGTRFQLKCGGRALDDYNDKYRNVRNIGTLLSAKHENTYNAVLKLNETLDGQKQLNNELKKRLVNALVASSANSNILFVDGLDIKELQMLSDALHKTYGGIRAVFSSSNGGYNFAICDESDKLDEFFAAFRKDFTVRGGGRNGMVQGSVAADEDSLKSYFQF
ncbi:MAG: alanyl-tRNA editing protein [Ruminococcaceae bacterium]|nr:alanyl-tRNA editing protein [Oscillospiraceae bacterium]